MIRLLRGLLLSLAAVAAVAAVVATAVPAAGTRTRCTASLSDPRGAPPCYDGAALKRFDEAYKGFRVHEAAANVARIGALNSLYSAVYQPPQGGSCKLDSQGNESSSNATNSTTRGEWILEEDLPKARAANKDAREDVMTMIGALRFAAQNNDVQDRFHDALESLRRSQNSFETANDIVRMAATSLKSLSCDDAMAQYEMAKVVNTPALETAGNGRRDLERARRDFGRAPCKDAATPVAPVSPGQTGAGSQLRSAGKLDIVAPRRVKLLPKGGTVLPLTLRAHSDGFVRIDLSRGKTTVASISRLVKQGDLGLHIRLSNRATRGAAQLRVVFVGSSDRSAVATLPIQLV